MPSGRVEDGSSTRERPGPPLARTTLDRSAHRRRDAEWLAAAWERARVLVLDTRSGGRTLITDDNRLLLFTPENAPDVPPESRLFLGEEPDGGPVFAVDAPLPSVAGARPASLRDVGHQLDDRDAGLMTTALALANWHAASGFSPVSGGATSAQEAGWSRIDAGGKQVWPRTDPAMIVLVHDGVPGPDGRCLLGNNAAWTGAPDIRRFSCLAGYVEPGESAEAAVIREVAEEVGLPIAGISYVASQPWPFPGSLMLGFNAIADPSLPVTVDPEEIVEARWFTRREIGTIVGGGEVLTHDGLRVGLPMGASIAHYLIATWLAE
ncbi:NAD(+) diphosphatase [Catenuloplanes nepalensis]|nr:NAD(+) diphosphatase [Catenuloplanes nepalensis]